jgi:hypothetical protein
MASKAQRRQARTEGKVRYGPQQRLLKQMLADVRSQFGAGLAGEESAYRALVDSARQGRPELQHIYSDAAGVAAGALTPAAGAPDLNAMGLGAGAAPFLGAASRDASATRMRLSQQLQASQAELVQREQQAAAGRAFAVGKLADDTAQQATKIRQQQSGLSSDEGAFVAQRLSELLKETSDRNFKASEDAKNRHNARLTAGVDAQGHVIPGGAKDKPGKGESGMLKPKSNSDALMGIDKAEAQLRRRINQGSSPEEAAKLLREGRDAVEGYPSRYTVNGKSYRVDPQTGTVIDGNKPLVYPGSTRIVKVDKAKLPAVSAMSPLAIRAALDRITYHGRYRKSTLKALHDAGIKVPTRVAQRAVGTKEVQRRRRARKTGEAMAGIFGAKLDPNYPNG